MNTFLLDTVTWDLIVDASGNIAIASDPYSVAQDVASACRTFVGDVFYNLAAGFPYRTQILAQAPPLALVKQWLINQASAVPGCSNPVVYLTSLPPRRLGGQIQFTDSNGQQQVVTF
jgi:hypothetical protein